MKLSSTPFNVDCIQYLLSSIETENYLEIVALLQNVTQSRPSANDQNRQSVVQIGIWEKFYEMTKSSRTAEWIYFGFKIKSSTRQSKAGTVALDGYSQPRSSIS